MGDPAVRAVELAKRYYISPSQAYIENPTLRDAIAEIPNIISAVVRRPSRTNRRGEPFWALKDVSFDIDKGQIIGIIGKNGAGKTTLLKILSRVIRPTSGYAEISGRVGSLLEVGIGFHPDLSGRENVYLNAAIMGIPRSAVRAKFEDIVGFSEIGDFIDTPVKRYSSGMYVRLAFSVAIHMEPDILIVDEVLSVGDSGFQRKSLERIRNIIRDGRTVLFVSHSMGTVREIANGVFWIDAGQLRMAGEPNTVCSAYEKSMANTVI